MEQSRRTRRQFLTGVGAAAGVALAGCSSNDGTSGGAGYGGSASDDSTTATSEPAPQVDWRTTAVTDVLSGEEFTIEEITTEPVLLEFFAVWCPVCTTQQQQVRGLLDRRDDVTVVSINTDPNENAETVREHAESKGFDWHYVVAPPEMTQAFVTEFGSAIASPPTAPVVRTCPDGSARLLRGNNVKPIDVLAAAIDEC